MADLSDVENALCSEVIGVLYPNGITQASTVGAMCRIYRGWPLPASLNTDLTAGVVNVTIFPGAAPDEVPDAYFDALYTTLLSTSLSLTVLNQSAVFGGTVTANQLVGILVDGVPFVYSATLNDTPDSIAANLSTLIQVTRPATLTGPTINIPGAASIVIRAVTSASVTRALRRQRREIQVSCWCPTPLLRDSVGARVDIALTSQSFINLADSTKAHVKYKSTQVYDQSQNALLYRRDLCYQCEFTITTVSSAPAMLFGDLSLNGGGSYT